MVYGSQYLRGMTPNRKDWERDLANMRKLNFNTIRAWLVWGVLEPAEGEIDYKYIDDFLGLAGKNDLQVIFLFHLHGCPEWAVGKYRKYWYIDQKGRTFEPSQRSNTPSGGWPGLCPDNPEVQAMEESFISSVVKHVSGREEISHWEPINEPHMWVDEEASPHGIYCYCPATRELFIQWLKRKYGELAKLENAWGRRFDCWESVRPPTWAFGFSDWTDWRTFTAENISSLVIRRSVIIRKHSSLPVIAHAWGGGSVTCTALGGMAFDDWKNAETVEKWGCSSFPYSINQTANIGLCMDAARSAAGGKEIWQSEFGTGDYSGGLGRLGRAKPEIFAIWCWEALSHGVSGLLYWQYRKETHGMELGCYGLTDYAGNVNEVGEMAGKIGHVLRKHSDLFLACTPAPAEAALVFSFQSYLTEWAQFRNCNMCCNSLNGYYRALWNENIPVDVLHEDKLSSENLKKYKILILSMPLVLPAGSAEYLKTYVRDGGVVLSDPYLCAFTADKSLSDEIPGQNLFELFGCVEDDVVSDAGEGEILLADGKKVSFKGNYFKEKWKLLPGARALAEYSDGGIAAVENYYGKGKAILFGINAGLINSSGVRAGTDFSLGGDRKGKNGMSSFISDIVRNAGIFAPVVTSGKNIRAKLLFAPGGERLLIAFNMENTAVTCALTIRKPSVKTCRNIARDEDIRLRGGEIDLAFNPYETKVLMVS